MKINITNGNSTLGQYVNVNYNENLDEYVDDGEAKEIRAIDILDLYPHIKSAEVIDSWIKKLAHGGKLVIQVVDLMEVAHGVMRQNLSIDDATLFLYGEQKNPDTTRKACFTLTQLGFYILSKGLKITKKRHVDYRLVIEAERP